MGRRREARTADGGVVDTVAGTAATVTRKAGRAARKAGTATEQAGAEMARRKPLTAAQAKRLIGISKAVAPLLAPYALAAATVARGRWDAYRAARLGVAPDQLSAYAGPGGALHARLSRIAESLTRLESGDRATAAGQAFATRTRPRLTDLSVAVRAAEQMPSSRRRAAYRAISGELDRIEIDLLGQLGVPT